ncbi:hypothetical protein Pla123a_01590 [Posidoniimonas polymericola]|uniref:Glycine transporter domain-containing protein n=1 Tax=Posidoniimonas polymericola TaxID=2528002 RepID=A0A5C5ZDE8_9BACT|nr:trimeric intracellular cation channel family protein [Posidoniimonas polymericola]TWT85352.1 hypothetical protein Pla123a_01590 [Posidoniimonas polymericola]
MLQIVEFLAVVFSALYGVLLARRLKLDFVGVYSVAFMVAFGGGTLRDLFLDRHPLFWIAAPHYPVIVFAMAVAAFFLPKLPEQTERSLNIPDAIGLAFFSIAGAGAALAEGAPLFIAAMMGAVTGTFGGVMADTICNRIPSIFRPSTPMYATCSFTGALLYAGLKQFPAANGFAAPIGVTLIIAFRLAALRYDWKLPAYSDGVEDEASEPADP